MTEPFAREFLDDYFAESEEHLVVLRSAVLALEEGGGRSWAPGELKRVQRALHTLKGLSGMVGFEEVERVAHALEDLVRSSVDDSLPAGVPVPLLYQGVEFVDRALSARRGGRVFAGAQEVVAALVGAGARGLSPEAAASRSAPVPTLVEVTFTPTNELLGRGLGVEAVRARLAAVGVVRSVDPRVPQGGHGVTFHFVVEVPVDWRPDPSWADEGIAWRPLDTTAPARAQAVASDATPIAPVAANLVRVDLARLDELMRLVGELVVSRSRLEDAVRDVDAGNGASALPVLQETSEQMERQLRALREGVMRVRLVPVGELFERLRFAIRDVARETGKDVAVDVVGADTEIDRLVVDRMMEPMLHLVRNAVGHGIESPETRARAGKARQGTISLRAAASGDRIRIEVEDDGAGVDAEAVIARAEAGGISTGGSRIDSARILELLCSPGLSTREHADRTSGRGVGMDVVRSAVRALDGELTMRSEPRRGTLFAVDLPLTLMIVDALLVKVGGQTMAVPQPALREVLKVDGNAATPMGDGEIISYRGGVLPLLRLARVFGMADGEKSRDGSFHVLVVGDDGDRVGLAVEGLAGLREIVVHPVDDPLVATVGVSGATELSDGRLGLILDAAALTRHVRRRPGDGAERRPAGVA